MLDVGPPVRRASPTWATGRSGHGEWFPIFARAPPDAAIGLMSTAGQGDIRRVASAPVELTEREHEMSALSSRADDARAGRGGAVLVCGESGAGKTSFVETFVEHWVAGERVLWGACDPLTTPRPLGPCTIWPTSSRPRRVRCCATAISRTRSSPPCSTNCCSDQPCWCSTTCTGPTRRPSTCCGSCCAESDRRSSLVVGTVRDDEIGADQPDALAARRRRPLAARRRRGACRR